jgi:quercetin dioxygenase-like cupin family protein
MTQNKNAPGEFPGAQAQQVAQLAEYGPGSVVSRTLVKGDSGTLTLFAFDDGEGLSEHSAPFDAWVHVLEGRVLLTIGGQPVQAGPGDIVRMPANVPHAVKAIERMKMLLTLFR